jgi:putative aldouronate transport system substrate-binding protein
MYKKLLAFLLAMTMVCGLLAGCGSTSSASSGTTEAVTASAEESDVASSEAENTTGSTGLSTGGLVLPLTEETVTLTQWWGGFNADDLGISTPAEVLVTQEQEARTGVHIEYTVCGESVASEVGAIMYAGGDYCDLISGGIVTYTGGFEKGVEDGIYIELNDLIDEYCPNYKAIMEADPDVDKNGRTDSGMIVAFYQVSDNAQWPWYGTLIRGDWLDDLGLEMPETYDELHDVLAAFKSEKGATYPLELGSSGYGWWYNYLAGCGVTDSWMQKDGSVYYSPVEDGYRAYLEIMSSWYSEGLINPDFMSVGLGDNSNIVSGIAGVFCGQYNDCDTYSSMIDGANVVGMPEPRLNKGDELHVGQVNGRIGSSSKWVAISASCSNPELAAQWLDYAYSEEGELLNNYGIENETFVYNENGEPELTELITNNPNLSLTNAMWRYLDGNSGVRSYIWERELQTASDAAKACEDTWAHDGAYMVPDMTTPTADESADQNAIMGDIETYVGEMTLKFITGQAELTDASWQEYCDYIWGLGLQDAVDIEQVVVDRYNQR